MAVSPAEVLAVAKLARLRLSPEEVARFTEQLNGILSHVDELIAVDAAGDEDGDIGGSAPLRGDEPGADPLLRPPSEFAPDWREGFFTVPRLPALDADEDGEPSA